jgi:hypothetical protein
MNSCSKKAQRTGCSPNGYNTAMERRFLIHKTGETFTVADKTGIGIRAEVAPSGIFDPSWHGA